MKASTVLALVVMTGAVTFVAEQAEGKRPERSPTIQSELSFELDAARGVYALRVDLSSAAASSVDMAGTARLEIDGATADVKTLGLDDRARLESEIRADGAIHQVCVRFEGTQTEQIKRRVKTSPVSYADCRQLLAAEAVRVP